jgi:hypothetical protein
MLIIYWLNGLPSKAARIALSALLGINLLPFIETSVSNDLFVVACLPSVQQPSKTPREVYLEKTLNYYLVYSYINQHLPADSRILILRDMRGYYLERSYLLGSPYNQSEIVYKDYSDAAAVRQRLAALGITHIFINMLHPSDYEDVIQLVDGVIERYGEKVYEANGAVLYKLKQAKTS